MNLNKNMDFQICRVPMDFDYPLGMWWYGSCLTVSLCQRKEGREGYCEGCRAWGKAKGLEEDQHGCPVFRKFSKKASKAVEVLTSIPEGSGYQVWCRIHGKKLQAPVSPVFGTKEELDAWIEAEGVSPDLVILNQGIGEKTEKFIMTDPDSFQLCRRCDEDAFELYQIQELFDPDGYAVCHAIVYLADIDAQSVCDCYGYKDLEALKKEYGDSFEQILAECDFEQQCANGECFITPSGKELSWAQATGLIRSMSGYQEEERKEEGC